MAPKHFILFLFLMTTCLSCSKKEPVIYQLTDLTKVQYEGTVKKQYFIISSPPSNTDSLIALVTKYNNNTLDSSDLVKYEYYRRIFYRETGDLNKDYTEDTLGHFYYDYIEDHVMDVLIITDWNMQDPNNSFASYSIWKDGAPTSDY